MKQRELIKKLKLFLARAEIHKERAALLGKKLHNEQEKKKPPVVDIFLPTTYTAASFEWCKDVCFLGGALCLFIFYVHSYITLKMLCPRKKVLFG